MSTTLPRTLLPHPPPPSAAQVVEKTLFIHQSPTKQIRKAKNSRLGALSREHGSDQRDEGLWILGAVNLRDALASARRPPWWEGGGGEEGRDDDGSDDRAEWEGGGNGGLMIQRCE